jgi:hypothetical protein
MEIRFMFWLDKIRAQHRCAPTNTFSWFSWTNWGLPRRTRGPQTGPGSENPESFSDSGFLLYTGFRAETGFPEPQTRLTLFVVFVIFVVGF